MNTRNIVFGVAGILATSAIAYVSSVSAYRGDVSQQGTNYTSERHIQMEQAFEAKDYTAWKNLMSGKGRVTEVINEGNFNRFVEMHELREDGKIAEADAIRHELGLHIGNGRGMKGGHHKQAKGASFVDANNNGVCDKSE
jgi:hypothetical protein